MATLAIVVDPAYGRMLFDIPKDIPVWIVDTPKNSEAARAARSDGASVTTYQCHDELDRLSNLRSMVPAAETHHGRIKGNYLVFGEGSRLQVIGLTPSEGAFNVLREFGFTHFSDAPDGFVASL
jgi:hypothetical protein